MGQRRHPICKRQTYAINPASTPECEDTSHWGRNIGERRHIAEPGAMRTAQEIRLPQGRTRSPGEVHGDGVVVRQDTTIRLQEARARVAPLRGLEADDSATAVEHLVDGLALVRRAGVLADGLLGGDHTAADELDPRVGQAVLVREDGDVVAGARVPAVGVAVDEDRVAGAPRVDVGGHLLQVGRARRQVAVLRPRVRVQVVHVDVDAVVDPRPHEREPLGRQAVGARRVAARVPLHAAVVDPVEVGERVQAVAERHAPGRRRAVGVRVGRVDVRVVVEVLRIHVLIYIYKRISCFGCVGGTDLVFSIVERQLLTSCVWIMS